MGEPVTGESGKEFNTRVFLENLPKDIRKDEVDKTFSRYGRIAKVYLIYDPPGSGFVEYFDACDAEYAAEQMDGADYMGSKVTAKVTRGGFNRGRGRGRGGFYPSSNYGYNTRGRFNSRGSYSRGGGGGYSRGGGYTRGGFRGTTRGFSRGSGYSRGGYSRGGGYTRGSYYRGSYTPRGSGGYRGRGSYDGYSNYKSYDKPTDNGYSRYPQEEKYDKGHYEDKYEGKYDKYVNYGDTRHEEYRSRSPVSHSPERFRSSSPSYARTSSSYGGRRSPVETRY
ncbi:uncharacterized protein LOC143038432 isoform X2 [Oratosquilla oratoria]|uniref:uncharacterized protein LOC143038432 isoform X2 n=1 Tax=Oratosquilla oratoria TaxID=337810 RepID=UPI003F75FC79